MFDVKKHIKINVHNTPHHTNTTHTQTMNDNSNNVFLLVQAQNILSNGGFTTTKNTDFKEIYEKISECIDKYCIHHLVHDTIDITPDHSKQITYCDVCFKTFPHSHTPIHIK